MFENIGNFFRRMVKPEYKELGSKDSAKERLHLVLMQDRANVSVDFLELMKQEIIDVIKKYIVVDEGAIDVRLTNKPNDDGTTGEPLLYATIPVINIKNDMKPEMMDEAGETENKETEEVKVEEAVVENKEEDKIEELQEEKQEKVVDEVKEEISEEPEKKKKRGSKKKNKEEVKENAEIETEKEDDEDDDVTFDDLLKAAEEEDKKVSEG